MLKEIEKHAGKTKYAGGLCTCIEAYILVGLPAKVGPFEIIHEKKRKENIQEKRQTTIWVYTYYCTHYNGFLTVFMALFSFSKGENASLEEFPLSSECL